MSEASSDPIWDTSDTRMQVCDIATATASTETVVLAFGAREADEYQVQAFSARLLQQIALRPESAKHLRDMLARALEDRGGARRANG